MPAQKVESKRHFVEEKEVFVAAVVSHFHIINFIGSFVCSECQQKRLKKSVYS
jgi:hypothetical protein